MKLNPKTKLITESLTVKLNSLANKLRNEGKNIINLTAGELDFPTPLFVQKEVRKNLHLNKYTPTIGRTNLRGAVTKQIYKDYKWKIRADHVAVTSGGKQALFESLFAILKKDDEVIVLTPDWVTYRQQIILNDAQVVAVPLDKQFDLDIEKIKKSISLKTKAIILNSPNNPTGSCYSQKKLLELKAILKNKNIFIIVDDVYSKIIYQKDYVSPAIVFRDNKNLILVNSFSKSQALTGWRIGYVVASTKIIEAVNAFQSHTTGNAPLLSQIAAEKIIEMGDDTEKFIKVLRERRDTTNSILATIPKISYVVPG
nr:aminotransferase class I/II-fold pyridoxal phosphate-dependent enzyme [Candidatus Paceibacterota bacterium]